MGNNRKIGMGVLSLAATAVLAGSAEAAVVSVSKVVNNRTGAAQAFNLEATFTVTEAMAATGIYGSMSIMLTDLRGDSAMLTSQTGGLLMSGWINDTKVKSFMPSAFTGPDGEFRLQVGAFGQSGFSGDFGSIEAPEAMPISLAAGDLVKVRVQFMLSAGDQAAVSGLFGLSDMVEVPAPGAMPIAATLLGLVRRRRFDNH